MLRHATTLLGLTIIALPLKAQETHFARTMSPGERLELSNLNGQIRVTQGTGRDFDLVATTVVKSGDPRLVKVILEEGQGFVRVCTIYLTRDPNRTSCRGGNSTDDGTNRRGERLDISIDYEVRAPAGVKLEVDNVNGGVVLRGLDTPATVETVNGGIAFDGVGAHRLSTVNGRITGRFTSSSWSGDLDLSTVNGAIDLTLPADFGAEIRGQTVNGGIDFGEFPVTMKGKWGPRTFTGTIGSGGRRVNIETVNGSVRLQRR